MNVDGVYLSTISSTDAQCIHFHNLQNGRAGCIPFRSQKYGRAGCLPLHRQQYVHAGCIPFLNAEMSDFPASGQSGTGMNKNADTGTSPIPEEGDPVRYRNALVPD
jgi:hypothetical protein